MRPVLAVLLSYTLVFGWAAPAPASAQDGGVAPPSGSGTPVAPRAATPAQETDAGADDASMEADAAHDAGEPELSVPEPAALAPGALDPDPAAVDDPRAPLPEATSRAASGPVPKEAPPVAAPATEVLVRGRSAAERMRRSAEAVHVVETEQAKRLTADLGEVLARTQGVGVQRAGGLGSDTRFSLNGLTDDQVRFFLDGVPLEFTGYALGIANVPVNAVERVEIYRGVVPIRLGADALGGAVNLVSDPSIRGTHSSGSVQAGSFGTYRLTLSARHLHAPSGWLTRVSGFMDRADNDYPMYVDAPDAQGRPQRARVHRFHDGYRAQGGNLELGFVDKPWAERLLLRLFVTESEKEIQHNLVMSYPYGDITLDELTAGGTLRYENRFARAVSLNAVAGYAYHIQKYLDVGECVYDWFGQCIKQRAQPGERRGRPEDQRYTEHDVYGRVNVGWELTPKHSLRLAVSPTFTGRSGDERRQTNPEARDPLSAQRQLFGAVAGLEYEQKLLAERFQNIGFVKYYLQLLRSEDPLSNGEGFRRRDRDSHYAGLGDSLRYAFAEWIYTKASYEWATRLPNAYEIFGNAFPVEPNLELTPERSHNVNLGLNVDAQLARAGKLRADTNGFLREADSLIVLVGNDKTAQYQNVYSARSLGVETALGWTSPGDYVALDGNFTYVDFRNTSREGAFAANEGARIPNRPYLFGNGSARLQLRQVAAARDELALIWNSRYVHAFYRGWEGLGTDKLTVNAQLLHSLALTYLIKGDAATLSFTGEAQNITDAAAFDFFGVPRPGRAFYFKATAAL
jgi:vitamin B12 transporter